MEKPEDLPEMTGLEFAAIRHRMNLSPIDLAKILDVTTRAVRRWEADGADIPPGVLEQLHALDEKHAALARELASTPGVASVRRDPTLYRALPRKWYVSALARAMEGNPDLRADWT
ncbi:Uncharacterised protein [Actinobaculum suis]|uniref:HTH cro/C1-type domain-containing protein n=1 Tax=Actinobaculum suis TaxID=1657 RepID=A0A7Z8Y728_9ACTO|nr:hypothetical protein [Actinobaculum suis]VDG75282.1 Uncharacterised protein [Actinobaculum suis]VDG76149.1 Uncharacterised protein [Actinobaculum suis]